MMVSELTKAIQTSRELVVLYREKGVQDFSSCLRAYVDIMADHVQSDLQAMNRRILSVLSSFLHLFFVHDQEAMVRQHVALSRSFLAETDPEAKATAFVRDLTAFLREYDEASRKNRLTGRVALYLKSLPSQALRISTVQSVAEHFGYHPNYFSQLFRDEQGYSLHQAINEERLDRVYQLLQDQATGLLEDLAQAFGFSDISHFRTLFKKRFNCLPSEVRRTD